MTIVAIAILTLAPVLLAQEPPNTAGPPIQIPDAAGPQVQIMMNGPLAGANATFISSEMVGGNLVTGAPYSAQAVTQTTQTLADGNRIVNNTSSMLYRDSQGRERRELPLPRIDAAGQPAQMIMISDPVAKMNYTLDANRKTAHKMPAPQPGQRMTATTNGMVTMRGGGGGGMAIGGALLTPPSDAPTFIYRSSAGGNAADLPKPTIEQLGTQIINGVQAVGTRTTTTIPAGQIGNDRDINIVSERWYSPDLKMTIQSKRTDPRIGETTYRLTQIDRSEPDPSLFQVPADYTVLDPPSGNAVFVQRPQQE